MSDCNTQTNSCETQSSTESCYPTEKSVKQDCCPVESSAKMWQQAFFCAFKETQVDILKGKIKKAYGPMMDKVADATMEATGVQWESVLTQAKAKVDLLDAIKDIYQSAKK